VFGSELAAITAAGGGLVVGTVSDDGEPRAVRAWAAVVTPGREDRLRVVMSADDPVSVANLATGRVAVTIADVRTFRSLQMKGAVASTGAPTAADLEQMRIQADTFLTAVHETDGNPLESLRRILPHEVVAFELVVEQVYDQTPGPDAGAALVARR
jgi:hypothetical protein